MIGLIASSIDAETQLYAQVTKLTEPVSSVLAVTSVRLHRSQERGIHLALLKGGVTPSDGGTVPRGRTVLNIERRRDHAIP